MSLQYFEEKKYLLIKMSFYLFIAILCAKILCVTWVLGRDFCTVFSILIFVDSCSYSLWRHSWKFKGWSSSIKFIKKHNKILNITQDHIAWSHVPVLKECPSSANVKCIQQTTRCLGVFNRTSVQDILVYGSKNVGFTSKFCPS